MRQAFYMPSLALIVSFLCPGCVGAHRAKYPTEWSGKRDIESTSQLRGTYANSARSNADLDSYSTMDSLWYFLTRQPTKCSRDALVQIEPAAENAISVQLLSQAGTIIEEYVLHPKTDFTWRNGALVLKPHSDVLFHPLGTIAGTETCRIRSAENGGLVGETSGVGAGLSLHIIPALVAGNTWYFWDQITISPEPGEFPPQSRD